MRKPKPIPYKDMVPKPHLVPAIPYDVQWLKSKETGAMHVTIWDIRFEKRNPELLFNCYPKRGW